MCVVCGVGKIKHMYVGIYTMHIHCSFDNIGEKIVTSPDQNTDTAALPVFR
jgi:hypothetical protein